MSHAADAPSEAIPPPTVDALQAMLDTKEYPAAIAGAARALQLRGAETLGYHRAALWAIKGEALLHTNQFAAAAAAFESGGREKDATDAERDIALATALLLRTSEPAGYRVTLPKRPSPAAVIGVIDPVDRKAAMAALLESDLIDLPPRIDALATTLDADPILKAVRRVVERRPIESVVQRSTGRFDALQIKIAVNYVNNISAWRDASMKKLIVLQKLAQHDSDPPAPAGKPATRRGLLQSEMSIVRSILDKAVTYARDEKKIAAAMSEAGQNAIRPAEPLIQDIYDLGHTVLSLGQVPRSAIRPPTSKPAAR